MYNHYHVTIGHIIEADQKTQAILVSWLDQAPRIARIAQACELRDGDKGRYLGKGVTKAGHWKIWESGDEYGLGFSSQ